MPELDERTTELLKEREALLNAVLELTREQPGLLSGEDYADGLLANIARRQELIDRIEGLGDGLPPPSPEEKRLLADIERQDGINQKLAAGRMEELREKLRRNKDGLTSLRGYEQRGDVGAVYFDRQK